jgi:hypothetical protein
LQRLGEPLAEAIASAETARAAFQAAAAAKPKKGKQRPLPNRRVVVVAAAAAAAAAAEVEAATVRIVPVGAAQRSTTMRGTKR